MKNFLLFFESEESLIKILVLRFRFLSLLFWNLKNLGSF
ncbi:MAG: hypothetical protein CH6_0451 [Candidatus Kapaibacterium sp.]|nr:MAG: hypothetical protein CH6_0451 [Candidatus Kapabacteria bacterium]